MNGETENKPALPKDAAGSGGSYARYLRKRKKIRVLVYRFFIYPRLNRYLRGRVLDVGCGIGDFLAFRKNTVGIDVEPENVQWCRQRGLDAHLIQGGKYPFDDAVFDGGIMDNVLEHIFDPRSSLMELHRVLKNGAPVIVGVPGERGYAYDPDHKRYYDAQSLVHLLSSHGFALTNLLVTPFFRSAWLSRHLRQYCIYGVFRKE